MTKITALALCVATLLMTGCGYKLRGTAEPTSHSTASSHAKYAKGVALNVNDGVLYAHLKKELALAGIRPNPAHTNQIHIEHHEFSRYELVGVLSEVRLVLTAKVRYELDGKPHHHTLATTKSYQYNEAGVSTQDKEEARVREWLYADMARQVSEQFYTLSQSPAPQTP